MKKIGLFTLCLLTTTISFTYAQEQYGHLNFGNLVASMPETEAADQELKAYREQLIKEGEQMAEAFQEKYGAFVSAVQAGELSPVQQQERQKALQAEQQKIVQFEEQVVQKVQNKRQELMEPIIAKAEQAINEVAEENGYVMIFDTSAFNAVLFAEDSDDVMPLVKAKLGLQ